MMRLLLQLLAIGIFLAIALSLATRVLGADRHCQITTVECTK